MTSLKIRENQTFPILLYFQPKQQEIVSSSVIWSASLLSSFRVLTPSPPFDNKEFAQINSSIKIAPDLHPFSDLPVVV